MTGSQANDSAAGADQRELDELRRVFFARTRRPVIVFYAFLGVVAAGAAAYGFSANARAAAPGAAAALAASLVLLTVSPMIAVPASAALMLVTASAAVGVAVALVVDIDQIASAPALAGAIAGFSVGTIVGIAAIRRRLASDDDLVRRQQQLGWSLEDPWAPIRSKKS